MQNRTYSNSHINYERHNFSKSNSFFILIKKHMQNKRWVGECESCGGQRIGNGLRGKSRVGLSEDK